MRSGKMLKGTKKADLAWNKIITWILILAFLLFIMFFTFGLDEVIKKVIDGFFGIF